MKILKHKNFKSKTIYLVQDGKEFYVVNSFPFNKEDYSVKTKKEAQEFFTLACSVQG
jgi:hypothetical protein